MYLHYSVLVLDTLTLGAHLPTVRCDKAEGALGASELSLGVLLPG